jgi:hypothetical protein
MVDHEQRGFAASRTLLAKKLEELAQSQESAREIAEEVAGTSEATAEVFSSRYVPASLQGENLGGDTPDGVTLRFAPR